MNASTGITDPPSVMRGGKILEQNQTFVVLLAKPIRNYYSEGKRGSMITVSGVTAA